MPDFTLILSGEKGKIVKKNNNISLLFYFHVSHSSLCLCHSPAPLCLPSLPHSWPAGGLPQCSFGMFEFLKNPWGLESGLCSPASRTLAAVVCVCVSGFLYDFQSSQLLSHAIFCMCMYALLWPFRHCVTLGAVCYKKAKALWSLTWHLPYRGKQDAQALLWDCWVRESYCHRPRLISLLEVSLLFLKLS